MRQLIAIPLKRTKQISTATLGSCNFRHSLGSGLAGSFPQARLNRANSNHSAGNFDVLMRAGSEQEICFADSAFNVKTWPDENGSGRESKLFESG